MGFYLGGFNLRFHKLKFLVILELLIHVGDVADAAFLVALAFLLSIGRLTEMEVETGGATSLPSTFLSSLRVSRVSFHFS
jgi:hypothetical protein